jgi:hypothetical protein
VVTLRSWPAPTPTSPTTTPHGTTNAYIHEPDAAADAVPDVAPDGVPDAAVDAVPDGLPTAAADAVPDVEPDRVPDGVAGSVDVSRGCVLTAWSLGLAIRNGLPSRWHSSL